MCTQYSLKTMPQITSSLGVTYKPEGKLLMVMPNTYWAISTRRRSNKAESIQAPSKKDWKKKFELN